MPKWLQNYIDLVRPTGVFLMFLVITLLPLFFAIIEIGFEGVGVRMATVLASYFKAVPDIFYNTLQIMFGVYVAGKSFEGVASRLKTGKTVVQADQAEVKVDQRSAASDPNV